MKQTIKFDSLHHVPGIQFREARNNRTRSKVPTPVAPSKKAAMEPGLPAKKPRRGSKHDNKSGGAAKLKRSDDDSTRDAGAAELSPQVLKELEKYRPISIQSE